MPPPTSPVDGPAAVSDPQLTAARESSGLAAGRDTDVLVIGGGVLGAAAAYYLAREGITTVLTERGELNREASGTNAGSLHFQVLRQPDYERERLDRIRPALPLYGESVRLWRSLELELGADLELHQNGGLMVAQTTEELEMLQRKAKLEREMGLSTHVLSRNDALVLCSHLADSVVAADYCPDEGSANPFLVTPAFAKAAEHAGATVRTRTAVSAIERGPRGGFVAHTSTGLIRARRIVNAAGAWCADVAAMVGIDLPVSSRPIQVNVTEPWAPLLGQMLQHVRRRLTLKQTPVGTFLLGGGWPAGPVVRGDRHQTTWEGMNANAWVAASVLPLLADLRIVRTWAGLIPITPHSMVPIVGECPGVPGFYVVASGVGFSLGPLLGRLLAELLSGRDPSFALHAFRPAGATG